MAIDARYLHTNLTVLDIKRMLEFYQQVFGCTPVRSEQDLSGQWLEDITGIPSAELRYVHLRLPGYGDGGPELELNQYRNPMEHPRTAADRTGFGHIAFAVDDVRAALDAVIAAGGGSIGDPVTVDIPGRGRLTEVYATDPEGNIIELQHYSR
ncbi:MAG: VOC family protein [Acidiferrobacterales bacterium]